MHHIVALVLTPKTHLPANLPSHASPWGVQLLNGIAQYN